MTKHLLFDAAGVKLAVSADCIRTVHEQLPVQAVAGTCTWFLGLAVAKGQLLPVTDLGAFIGRESSRGRTLELMPQVALAALKVDDVSGLSHAQVAPSEQTGSREHALGQQLGLTGEIVGENGVVHHVMDMSALVQLPAFNNIRESES